MKTLSIKIFILLALLTITSCTENEVTPDPTKGMTKIAEGTLSATESNVEVWAKEALYSGYNPVYIRVRSTKNNQIIHDADVSLSPLMYMMGGMNHACPIINPTSSEAEDGLFAAGIYFVMPTSDMGYWKLTVAVHNHENELEGEVALDITVTEPDPVCMRSFTATSGTKYFIGHYFPSKMKVGINDWIVTAFTKESMMSWPAAENLTFELTPEMPSMDHGSPNNVHPAHTTGAYYAGKVNFTMTGEWRLNLKIYSGEALLQETYFDVNVE